MHGKRSLNGGRHKIVWGEHNHWVKIATILFVLKLHQFHGKVVEIDRRHPNAKNFYSVSLYTSGDSCDEGEEEGGGGGASIAFCFIGYNELSAKGRRHFIIS